MDAIVIDGESVTGVAGTADADVPVNVLVTAAIQEWEAAAPITEAAVIPAIITTAAATQAIIAVISAIRGLAATIPAVMSAVPITATIPAVTSVVPIPAAIPAITTTVAAIRGPAAAIPAIRGTAEAVIIPVVPVTAVETVVETSAAAGATGKDSVTGITRDITTAIRTAVMPVAGVSCL